MVTDSIFQATSQNYNDAWTIHTRQPLQYWNKTKLEQQPKHRKYKQNKHENINTTNPQTWAKQRQRYKQKQKGCAINKKPRAPHSPGPSFCSSSSLGLAAASRAAADEVDEVAWTNAKPTMARRASRARARRPRRGRNRPMAAAAAGAAALAIATTRSGRRFGALAQVYCICEGRKEGRLVLVTGVWWGMLLVYFCLSVRKMHLWGREGRGWRRGEKSVSGACWGNVLRILLSVCQCARIQCVHERLLHLWGRKERRRVVVVVCAGETLSVFYLSVRKIQCDNERLLQVCVEGQFLMGGNNTLVPLFVSSVKVINTPSDESATEFDTRDAQIPQVFIPLPYNQVSINGRLSEPGKVNCGNPDEAWALSAWERA